MCEASSRSWRETRSMKSHEPISPITTSLLQINPKWAWHQAALLDLREELLQAQSEHKQAATSQTETGGIDYAEAARDESEHAIVLAELLAESERLSEIDAALERMRMGTFGICERTGKPISAVRLRAIPWTRYAVPHNRR